MTKENKKGPWGNLSCKEVLRLIEEEKERKLDPFERNAVFAHCTVCDECREVQIKVLDEIIGEGKLEDFDK